VIILRVKQHPHTLRQLSQQVSTGHRLPVALSREAAQPLQCREHSHPLPIRNVRDQNSGALRPLAVHRGLPEHAPKHVRMPPTRAYQPRNPRHFSLAATATADFVALTAHGNTVRAEPKSSLVRCRLSDPRPDVTDRELGFRLSR
jgi:hypothetical protein